MARVYDLESLLTDLEALFKANLNNKIASIDNEKPNSLGLKPVVDEAYFLQTLNERAVNVDPFILYGVEDIQSTGLGPATQSSFQISVVLALADHGEEMNTTYRMFRYQRAIREVLEENWNESTNGVKLTVTSLVPVQLSLFNSDDNYRAIGVLITASMA